MILVLVKNNDLKVNLKELNTNSGRQRYHVVDRDVGELLACLAGPHQNPPAVANDLGSREILCSYKPLLIVVNIIVTNTIGKIKNKTYWEALPHSTSRNNFGLVLKDRTNLISTESTLTPSLTTKALTAAT